MRRLLSNFTILPLVSKFNRRVPHRKHTKTYNAFLDLPRDNWCCTAVDEIEGKWVDCFCGSRVPVENAKRTFTIGNYIAHCKNNAQHRKAVTCHEEDARLEAWRKEKWTEGLTGLKQNQLAAKTDTQLKDDAKQPQSCPADPPWGYHHRHPPLYDNVTVGGGRGGGGGRPGEYLHHQHYHHHFPSSVDPESHHHYHSQPPFLHTGTMRPPYDPYTTLPPSAAPRYYPHPWVYFDSSSSG